MKEKVLTIARNGRAKLEYQSLGVEKVWLYTEIGPFQNAIGLSDDLTRDYPDEIIFYGQESKNTSVEDFPEFIEKAWFESMNTVFRK